MEGTISIVEAAHQARQIGFDSAAMTLVSPFGQEREATWGDAYLGVVMVQGKVIWQNQLESLGFRAKNVRAAS